MKHGFTLAEVLITLLIIGIVAALTIPSVISNYQQQEFKTGLKKAVSVLNEAIQTNIVQEGETPYENRDLFNYLQRHMSVLRSGRYRTGTNNFFYTTDGMVFEMLHPIESDFGTNTHFKLYETGIDLYGARYSNRDENGNPTNGPKTMPSLRCGSYGLGNNPNNTTMPPCLVMVDVNGDKKPNPSYVYWANGAINFNDSKAIFPHPADKKLTDIFNIMITEEKAIPFGVVAQRAMYSK